MTGSDDDGAPGAAKTIRNLLHSRAEKRGSAFGRPAILPASSASIGALLILHGAGLALWVAANLGLLPSVLASHPNHVQFLAVFLSLEAVLLCALVLARQDRMGRLAEERSRLNLQAALLLEAEVTEVLQQLARINARLGISQQDTKPS